MAIFWAGPDSEWAKKSSALLRAFERLPIVDPPRDSIGIPYRFVLGDIPRQLMLMRPTPKRKLLQDKKALYDLAQLSGRTIKIMSGLSDNARSALNLKPEALRQFQISLVILHGGAKEAAKLPASSARRGAPKKTRATEITDVVAEHFFGLTGKKAPAEPFPKLLATVFAILGVDAKATSQAKFVGKKRKSI
jgi:hypothetical protein